MTDKEKGRPLVRDGLSVNNSAPAQGTANAGNAATGQAEKVPFRVDVVAVWDKLAAQPDFTPEPVPLEAKRAFMSALRDACGPVSDVPDDEGFIFDLDGSEISGYFTGSPMVVIPRELKDGHTPALRADFLVADPGADPEYIEDVIFQGAHLLETIRSKVEGKMGVPAFGRLEPKTVTKDGRDCTFLILDNLTDEVELLALKKTYKDVQQKRQEARRRENRVQKRLEDLRVHEEAKRRHAEESGQSVDYTSSLRAHTAGSWLSVEEEEVEPLWGTREIQLWAPGESTMLVGPPSVGKSTLAHLLIWGRLGLIPEVLGYPVKPDTEGGVLYLAMDRPSQIRRAMRRLVMGSDVPAEELARILDERMTIWEGPLPVDITVSPRYLVSMAQYYGRNTIVIDSTKDVLPNASDEAKAGGYNTARQEALAEGLNWLELHHNRKSNGDSKEPNTLDDVYGSRWITAGAGSVLSLYGQPGDIVVKLTHLKPLAEPLFPQDVALDRATGGMRLYDEMTPERVLATAGPVGATVTDAAALLFDGKKPTKSQVESTRNKLERLVKSGKATKTDGNPARYIAAGGLEFIPTAEAGGADPFEAAA